MILSNNSDMRRVVKNVSHHIEWDFFGPIECIEYYHDLLDSLDSASEQDLIVLNINSSGGRLDIGYAVVNAVKSSSAAVIANIVWPSYSMAAFLACACDSVILQPNTFLLFHSYSGTSEGKSDEIIQHVNENDKVLRNRINETIHPFLNKKELQTMWDGKDVYVRHSDPDLKSRINRHFKKPNVK